jgi:hypothetical protein
MTNRLREIFVVDRVEADVVVLEGDDGRRVELAPGELPAPVAEGGVLLVPVFEGGDHDWGQAMRDRREELRRIEDRRERQRRVHTTVSRGDVTL